MHLELYENLMNFIILLNLKDTIYTAITTSFPLNSIVSTTSISCCSEIGGWTD